MGAQLATWSQYVDLLKGAEALVERLPADGGEQIRADLYRQFAMNLAQGYFLYFQSSADHPEFSPFENSVFLAQPNPDAVYYYARVSGEGVYRIVGERGTAPVAGFAVGREIIGMAEAPGRGLGAFDLDDLTLDGDGRFEVIFSRERPSGWAGDWRPLHPEADFILVRQFSYDWGREADVRLAIERLDAPEPLKPRMSPGATDRLLKELFGGYVRRLSRICLDAVDGARNRGLVNRMGLTSFQELGNGQDWPQAYFECVFELAEDEALILETALPQVRPYWNVQVIDPLWNQVELVYRQSSLNGRQARLDRDGRFRAVLAHSDPGVANWLDTGGNRQGMLIGRWYRCSSQPTPELRKVKVAELDAALPDDVARIGLAEREAMLRERRIGAQLRRKW
jgi:hypothetical protein